MPTTRNLDEIRGIHDLPFPLLATRAAKVHGRLWDPTKIQMCTLDPLRSGACEEDCAYCAQSAHHATGLKPDPLKDQASVIEGARRAKSAGATRYCMATSGRVLEEGPEFDRVLDIIGQVRALGMEACVSLGLITDRQAARLKQAGCTVYNHNLDSSRMVYERIVTTHTFDDRLATIRAVSDAGLKVCCGGILGLGESPEDRIHFLHELTLLDADPEAIPLNQLVPIAGTPLEGMAPIHPIAFLRVVATARILFPSTRIRLAAGRHAMSDEMQALAFLCGANSIFTGEKLLTTPGPRGGSDSELLGLLGMTPEGSLNEEHKSQATKLNI